MPPQVWRRASVPLVARLSGRGGHRPQLDPDAARRLIHVFADDIALLSTLTGEDFSDWLSPVSRGSFDERAAR